jgi:hypothetical protein
MGSNRDKAFVAPTFQRWQHATDPTSKCHPPAGVNLRGRPRRPLRLLVVVVVVKARWRGIRHTLPSSIGNKPQT